MYRGLENLYPAFVPHPDVIARLGKGWLLNGDAMSDELGVLLCFPVGHASVSYSVMSRKSTCKIKVELLHKS
jgi:hypothetical protein